MTDFAQQTPGVNAIDDETIRENELNEIRRTVCYDQPIYIDTVVEGDEWLGLTLGIKDFSVITDVRPHYDQAAILIVDDDGKFYK